MAHWQDLEAKRTWTILAYISNICLRLWNTTAILCRDNWSPALDCNQRPSPPKNERASRQWGQIHTRISRLWWLFLSCCCCRDRAYTSSRDVRTDIRKYLFQWVVMSLQTVMKLRLLWRTIFLLLNEQLVASQDAQYVVPCSCLVSWLALLILVMKIFTVELRYPFPVFIWP